MPSKDQIADALLEHKHVGRAAEGLGLGERNRARLRVPNGTRCCWRNYEQQTQAQYNGTQHFHKALVSFTPDGSRRSARHNVGTVVFENGEST